MLQRQIIKNAIDRNSPELDLDFSTDPNTQDRHLLKKLSNLEILRLKLHKCHHFPSEICRLKQLKELYVGGQLKDLPDQFAQLQNLERLVLAGHSFDRFPLVVCKLKSIESLNIGNNPLRSLPSEIGYLGSLDELFVHDCMLETLPKEIGQLTNLRSLSHRVN